MFCFTLTFRILHFEVLIFWNVKIFWLIFSMNITIHNAYYFYILKQRIFSIYVTITSFEGMFSPFIISMKSPTLNLTKGDSKNSRIGWTMQTIICKDKRSIQFWLIANKMTIMTLTMVWLKRNQKKKLYTNQINLVLGHI